jgi:hypothetical protein
MASTIVVFEIRASKSQPARPLRTVIRGDKPGPCAARLSVGHRRAGRNRRLTLAPGKNEKAYLLVCNNLRGTGGSLAVGIADMHAILSINSPLDPILCQDVLGHRRYLKKDNCCLRKVFINSDKWTMTFKYSWLRET